MLLYDRGVTRVKFIINDCEVFRCSGNEAVWMSGVCASLHSRGKTRLFPWQPLCIHAIVAALHPTRKHQASLLKITGILLHLYSTIKRILVVASTVCLSGECNPILPLFSPHIRSQCSLLFSSAIRTDPLPFRGTAQFSCLAAK